jgi:tRNA-2-methylthio-N6-dimethylallyladenosine synthase
VVEVTLLGQTVNSYKYRQPDGRSYRLSDLLERLHAIEGLARIKFITNYPSDMTDDLLHAVRDLPKVCRYVHVPAQSGCDQVLRRMKRQYTVAEYDEMLARIREVIPGCAVSSDFIVGFCGESEVSFQRSVALVERGRFKNSFIFKYSPRPGTKAPLLYADDVPEEVKRRRNNDLLAVQTKIGHELNRELVGRTFPVLVEGRSEWARDKSDDRAQLTGRTMCDRIVVFEGGESLIGRIIPVTIQAASPVTLFGEIVDARDRMAPAPSSVPRWPSLPIVTV